MPVDLPHSEHSELRLTDSSEGGIKPVVYFSREKDKAEECMCEWRGIMRQRGTKQQFKQCVLTSNCWKHLAQVAYAFDEFCACKCSNYLCISAQCNLLWG